MYKSKGQRSNEISEIAIKALGRLVARHNGPGRATEMDIAFTATEISEETRKGEVYNFDERGEIRKLPPLNPGTVGEGMAYAESLGLVWRTGDGWRLPKAYKA